MLVYIVMLSIAYEGSMIEGVYLSYEEALKGSKKVEKVFKSDTVSIRCYNTITQKMEVYRV